MAFNDNARRGRSGWPSESDTAVGSGAGIGHPPSDFGGYRGEDGLAGNLEKLEDAGLIFTRALPKAHREVLEGLSEEEVRVILSVADRLREADQDEGLAARPAWSCSFMSF